MLDSIDVWFLQQDTLINKRNRALLPVVKERQILADALARYLAMLGLVRRVKFTTFNDILTQDDEHKPHANGSEQGNGKD